MPSNAPGQTYGTITPDGVDNSVMTISPSAGGGTKLRFSNEVASGHNSATKQFVSGDDVNQSYGSMEPQPNPGDISTVTTVPKGQSYTSPSFNGTNIPGTQNGPPLSGYGK